MSKSKSRPEDAESTVYENLTKSLLRLAGENGLITPLNDLGGNVINYMVTVSNRPGSEVTLRGYLPISEESLPT